jgi:UDP:flavonoid glycosyltransferase YjiC (YdhE family)
MTLLVISPDYASHLLPLATLATAWRDAGERVVVATGPATAGIVAGFGLERVDLRLGRGSNPGVIRAEEQPAGEDEALRGFFAATRHGLVPTMLYQARARRADLLWQPVDRGRAVLGLVERLRPDRILVDHLAFSARLGLTAGGIPHADVVLGHPSALPVGDEVYGHPADWPSAFHPQPAALAELRRVCRDVADAFTGEWNAALRALSPGAEPVRDALAAHGPTLLLNYPAALHDPARTALLPPHVFLGSAVRTETAPAGVRAWLDADDRPIVYVSFGSFLSARADVLATVLTGLRDLDVRVAVATGSARDLPATPAGWLVRPFLPQTALLPRAAAAVTHGGNNSVTEALACGVPMLVLPFSTDQFAGAAAIESAGLGAALDPNAASAADVTAAVRRILDGTSARRAAELAADLRARPGPQRARAALAG